MTNGAHRANMSECRGCSTLLLRCTNRRLWIRRAISPRQIHCPSQRSPASCRNRMCNLVLPIGVCSSARAQHLPAVRRVRACASAYSDEVRVLLLVLDGEVRQLDVEVLVDGVERAAQLQIVLQLNDHLLTDE